MEYFDVIDINRKPLNKVKARGEQLEENEYNVGVEAWILNSKREVLITQRSKNKSHSNLWECPGGCSIAGESSLQTLKREMEEEIGIDISNIDVKYVDTKLYKKQFVDIYTFNIDIDITKLKLQEEEVQDAKWVSIEELENMYKKEEVVKSVMERFYQVKDKI